MFFSRFQTFRETLCRVSFVVGFLLFLTSSVAAQQYTVQEASLDGGGGVVSTDRFEVTSALATQPVGTAQTDRYVLYSAWPSPFVGQLAILIEHDPGAGGPAQEGQSRDVTARIVTNDAPLQSATLYYRPGGEDTFTSVSMTADDSDFVGTIPGSAVTEDGLTYYFEAVDEQGTTMRAPRRGVSSLPVRLGDSGIQKPGAQPGGSTQSAYRLISMPVVLDDPSPEAVLGDDIPSLASAAAYEPSEARLFEPIGTRVAEFPGTGDFELGRAFWLIVRDGVDSLDAGQGTVKALNEPVEIDLSSGWNFVGTPFTNPVPVENLQTESGEDVTLRAYGEEGYNTPDEPVTEMDPFEGYAVYVESATTLTIAPPLSEDEKSQSSKTAVGPAEERRFPWRLRVRGSASSGRDADNVAAVHTDASDNWDAQDWLEPPSVGSGLHIAFDAPDGAPADVSLSADVRQPFSQGATWPLIVESEEAGPVRLSVEGIKQVPAAFEVRLVDETTKMTWNLRDTRQARFEVLSEEASRSFQLVVGTEAYVREVLRDLEAMPREYALRPPYPNPSSGPVAFQVGLPEDNRVTLSVYNVLGQRVALVKDDEAMSAGFHTVVWDAPRLASGVYFVHVEAGDYRASQKLVRVR
jgi:hypothetical protein